MHSVLLFSAVIHIAAVGLLCAMAVRAWLDSRRPSEPSFPEFVLGGAALGLVVGVITTILMWMARGFGQAAMAGLIAGVLAAAAFLLFLGALPELRTIDGRPASQAARLTAAAFVGTLVLTELIAFSFLIAQAGGTAPHT